MKKLKFKILSIIMLILTLFSVLQPLAIAATEISKADVKASDDLGQHIQFRFSGGWNNITGHYQYYTYNGVSYPAYCLDADRLGAGDVPGGYTVSVEDVIKDNRIWRVMINGYPYKTASQMGVTNWHDAYMATKQAVYCILYDRDVRDMYRGVDARGDLIVDAMERLVNEGRNGTRTPQSANLTITKVGDFVEDGNYYSQTYSVTSIVNIDTYTITNTPNMPSRRANYNYR